MSFDCIVSQVHIPPYDCQGNLTAADKLKLVDFAITHLRRFNPNAYIILTGHGQRPTKTECCDYVYWNDNSEPLDEHGYVRGMPAQYKYVSYGLHHALEKGFNWCLKTRGDCVIGIPNISDHCKEILEAEQKVLLLTQQTGYNRMGDCFMYGDLKLLARLWHHDNPVYHEDGLQNTAYNYRRAVNDFSSNWLQLLRRTCSFRDVHRLKFTCLRWNYYDLKDRLEQLLDPTFDFAKYHWGLVNNWHRFNHLDNMIIGADYLWSAKQFYREQA